MPGRKITIFLVDGTSSGVRSVEFGLSTIKALAIPRASLSSVKNRPEVSKSGVYVLTGPDVEIFGQKRIYIGETENILTRLANHDKDTAKDFWDEAVIFVSKDDNLTKGHIRYLEARLIALAREAKIASITNETVPSEQGRLPEADTVEMEEFIAQARLILGVLGHNVFESIQAPTATEAHQSNDSNLASPVFKYSGDGFDAQCLVDISGGQFIVRKGSKARKEIAPSLSSTYRNLRDQLITNGILTESDEYSFCFTQDYAFGAASPAAQVVSGTSVNGRTSWKTDDGRTTFADWQDRLIPQGDIDAS